ncbi:gliding motility lipoprotein GldB [Winogradskyella psychrotolerans]|uniref:gliding motility lipoprotein GldB n=1 Tax=Winogradskyella psychrotolerans TaxID=1344585 RepID=UPI001C07EAC9|nr:gliding motility lipoprotein GldB [Winogradskyella psychrotolerans]MBU2929209.1 gliding motility lipoprotein GldB [Winogradskyella psychrotolerans]
MQIKIYFILLLGFTILSCDEDSKVETEIAKVEVDFTIERFDKAFYEATPKYLPKLKRAYPFFFSKHEPDSIVVERMNDTLQNEILREVDMAFKDIQNTKQELVSLFQYLKYYDKVFSTPRVITLINNVQYRDNVIVTDSIVLVALDNYLGENHRFYVDGNIPVYLAKNFKKEQIVVDLADAYAKKYAFQSKRKALLEEMIYFGKLLYFKDVVIPFKTDAEKMGYTESEIKWAEANESQIWSYLIEKELLYSTDPKLPNRFIADAPFTKFYLELDNESPGRLGQYIGWQIVKAYAENSGDDLMKIMQTEPEEIFRKSKFKPKK